MTDQTVVAPPPTAAAYEFSKTENSTIARAAKWAKALAIMFFITTAVQAVNLNILGIVVDLAIGISFWKGASFLDKVVTTEGDDVPNMLDALDQLQTAFMIRIVVTGIAAVVGLFASVYFFVQYEYLYDPADVEQPAATVEDAEDAEDEPAEQEDDAPEDEAPQAAEPADAAPAPAKGGEGGEGGAPAADADDAAPAPVEGGEGGAPAADAAAEAPADAP